MIIECGKIRSSEAVQETISTVEIIEIITISALPILNVMPTLFICVSFITPLITMQINYFLSFSLSAHTLINTFGMLFWYLGYTFLGALSSYIISVILNFSINTTNEPYLMPQTKQDHQRIYSITVKAILAGTCFRFNRQVRQAWLNTKLQVNVEKFEAK